MLLLGFEVKEKRCLFLFFPTARKRESYLFPLANYAREIWCLLVDASDGKKGIYLSSTEICFCGSTLLTNMKVSSQDHNQDQNDDRNQHQHEQEINIKKYIKITHVAFT